MRLLRCILALAIMLGGTSAVAKEDVQRFDNGPLLSEANAYFRLSADTLNWPANSESRQRGLAFVARLAGSTEAHKRLIDDRSLDDISRGYMMSVDGWLLASARRRSAYESLGNPTIRDFGAALPNVETRLSDRSSFRLPPGQSITMYLGDLLATGDALLARSVAHDVSGEYTAATRGECPFGDGTIKIVQDRFLVEGLRGNELLFWGAIGQSKAWFIARESKYLKITIKRRKKGQIEFPDETPELFGANLGNETMILTGEFRKKCTISLVRQPDTSNRIALPVDEPGWFTRLPDEEHGVRRSTPGVSLSMLELKRETGGEGSPEVTYAFKARDFPRDKVYSLWAFYSYQDPARLLSRLVVDDDGVMVVDEVTPDGSGQWEPAPLETALPLTLHSFKKGEEFRFGLISADEQIKAYTSVVPESLETRQGPCYLRLGPWLPGDTVFAAQGSGFTRGEVLRVDSKSGDSLLTSKVEVDADGEFFTYVHPEVPGERRGVADLTVAGESCSLSLEYEWGAGSK